MRVFFREHWVAIVLTVLSGVVGYMVSEISSHEHQVFLKKQFAEQKAELQDENKQVLDVLGRLNPDVKEVLMNKGGVSKAEFDKLINQVVKQNVAVKLDALINEAKSEHSNKYELLIEAGELALSEGELSEAARTFVAALSLRPYDQKLMKRIAGIYETLGDFQLAGEFSKKASVKPIREYIKKYEVVDRVKFEVDNCKEDGEKVLCEFLAENESNHDTALKLFHRSYVIDGEGKQLRFDSARYGGKDQYGAGRLDFPSGARVRFMIKWTPKKSTSTELARIVLPLRYLGKEHRIAFKDVPLN